jgi:hypothetical protein
MKTVIAVCFVAQTLLSVHAQAEVPAPQIDYRFDQVKRKVELNASQIAAGHHARSGDKVQTGWFSYALIASEHYRAKFEIFSSTNVQLAGGTPGVILSLERGRLHAMFDKITGSEPRVVQTPGALLAVRGTQYDVDVDREGHTSLKVYEGIVEVQSVMQPQQPMLVHAGEMADFGRHQAPNVRPMPDDHGRGQRDSHGMSDPGHGKDPHGDHPEGQPPQGPPPRGTNPPPPPSGKPDGHH